MIKSTEYNIEVTPTKLQSEQAVFGRTDPFQVKVQQKKTNPASEAKLLGRPLAKLVCFDHIYVHMREASKSVCFYSSYKDRLFNQECLP